MMNTTTTENRRVSRTAAGIITFVVMATFAAVWLGYYNRYAFRTHQALGGIACLIVYFVLYLRLAEIYRAFKIASFPIAETAFGQCLSFGIADLALYVTACLAARRYVNIWWGALTAAVQIGLAILWAVLAKRYFLAHIEPRKCLLLFDAHITDVRRLNGRDFLSKIESSYGHLFRFADRMAVDDNIEQIFARIEDYSIIFLYDLPLEKRSHIMQHCVNTGKRVYMTPTIGDVISRGYEVKHLVDTPLFSYGGAYKTQQSYFGKRLMDIIISLFLLILTSPILLATALLIKLEDGGVGEIIGTTEKSPYVCGILTA